ncbi:hypothetical protein SKAU_G00018080 [Synaphobranchus kaupii]|uniref:Uncharacterized protein n=1 Tax=Synaphobranchus kaupii TaxID=118154 RepID=A0A9Q1JDL5_SYNKA|nr:hypothetical protein SKAU_G00018080 [Synaphobranchus kaupii]
MQDLRGTQASPPRTRHDGSSRAANSKLKRQPWWTTPCHGVSVSRCHDSQAGARSGPTPSRPSAQMPRRSPICPSPKLSGMETSTRSPVPHLEESPTGLSCPRTRRQRQARLPGRAKKNCNDEGEPPVHLSMDILL